jgi:DNA-binding SARP family transcriptional activator
MIYQMSTQQIKLLGKPKIEVDGEDSPITKSAKGLALLAYLLVTQQAHVREEIADLLWEADSTAKSLNNLRQLLSRLRGWLPDLQISATEVGYEARGFVDLMVVQAGLTAVDHFTLDEALQLYQGDLLEGVYLPDAPRFNEWLMLEREQLRQRITTAYEQLCTAYAQQENWAKGVAAAQRWLSLDDLDETALRYLLQFLAASGQIEVALRQYEISQQHLWAALEVEPNAKTIQLVQRLQQLRQKHGGGLSWAAIVGAQMERPSPHQLAEPGNLPANAIIPYQRNHDFTGRRESLLHLANLLLPQAEAPEYRTVAVTGMAGLGKTQVAVEFCYRYGRYFAGGIYWLNFADSQNVAAEVSEIGSERGMGLYREADNLRQADKVGRVMKAWQEPIPRLLIFDNCEDEALLTKWLPVTGGCAILLTSRRANWTRELQIASWPLPFLDVAESVRLLQNLVPNLAAVDATNIAEELGHLPLALHLAGSFLRRYRGITADQYLTQLRHKALLSHPSLQGRGTDFSPTGHELNVARTFTVNWERLNEDEAADVFALRLLACAAQFAPDVPLPRDLLFAAVLADENDLQQLLLVEDGLARLIALGFVRIEAESRLRVHRLVMAFVQARLQDRASGQTAVTAATAVATTIWQRIQAQWETEFALDQLAIAPAHVQYVMEVELAKETIEAVHLTHIWGRHLSNIGDFAGSRIYLEKVLALSEKLYGTEQAETADILMTLGSLTWKSGSEQAAWPYYERAFAIYEHLFGMVHVKTADGLASLAILHARTGAYEAAIAKYEQALTIYEQVLPPVHRALGLTLYNLAIAYRRLGAYQIALSHYEVSLHIQEQIYGAGNPHILNTLASMGITYFLMGNYETAHHFHQKALTAREERLGRQHPQTAVSLGYLGITLGFLGNYEAAVAHLQESLVIREQIYGSDHPQLVHTLTYLGYMLHESGELEAARRMLERGRAIQEAKQLENEQTAETLTRLAAVLMQTGEMETAGSHLQRALAIWEQRPELKQSRAAATRICWGEWWAAQGDAEAALSYYEQAVTILTGRVAETHRCWQRVQAHLAGVR